MKRRDWIIIFVIIILIIFLLIIWYLFKFQNPYDLATWLNEIIDEDRLKQNKTDQDNMSPNQPSISSYCSAKLTHNKLARRLDQDLMLDFDQIKQEILDLHPEYKGVQMTQLDPIQNESFSGTADEWRVIWVRFFGQFGQKANQLPTLKKIIQRYPEIVLLHVSIMAPGTILPEHVGISKAVLRYHLPIQIPKGDQVYLHLDGKKIKWKEGEGFVFDDCLPHGVVMKPIEQKPRIVIFADIPREYEGWTGPFKSQLSSWFHWIIRENEWIQKIQDKI